MVYKPSSKNHGSRLTVSLPGASQEAIKKLFGDTVSAGSDGPKMMKFNVSEDASEKIFGTNFAKHLRYGARLSVSWPLTLTFSKTDLLLKLSGTYVMEK
jgi:hypothetical protein